ncbi:MAG: ankyrin repeat domain-containing protein [Proteobacteria bacterium]|nr:ankyrin repeat domain-containing protein [Pseudomonadota bacterium]
MTGQHEHELIEKSVVSQQESIESSLAEDSDTIADNLLGGEVDEDFATEEVTVVKNDNADQSGSDALESLKEQIAQEDEKIKEALKTDLESLGLDIIDEEGDEEDKEIASKDDDKATETTPIIQEAVLDEDGFATADTSQEETKTQANKTAQVEEAEIALPILEEPTPLETDNKTEEGDMQNALNSNIDLKKELVKTGGEKKSVIQRVEERVSQIVKSITSSDEEEEKKDETVAVAAQEETKSLNEEEKKLLESKAAEEQRKAEEERKRKEEELEKRIALDELNRRIKLRKLNRLREEYLVKSDREILDENIELDRYRKMVTIEPRRKELPRFINEEVPTQLLNRYRSRNNRHLPIMLSYKEKVNAMFQTIVNNEADGFNALFKLIDRPNIKNSQGDTVLTFATLLQRHDIMASLLSKGADPDMANHLGYTPLNIAIELLDYKSVSLLIDMGANVNFVDALGRNYLMQASRVGSLPIADLLIHNDLDVNREDNNELTALDIAYRQKKEVIVKLLVKEGAQRWRSKKIEKYDKSIITELWRRWE